MSEKLDAVINLANAALAELTTILNDENAAENNKLIAFERYEDIELIIAQHAIDEYGSRTAILTGLITELTLATKDIQIENPIADSLTKIAIIGEKAGELFAQEKTDEKAKNRPAGG